MQINARENSRDACEREMVELPRVKVLSVFFLNSISLAADIIAVWNRVQLMGERENPKQTKPSGQSEFLSRRDSVLYFIITCGPREREFKQNCARCLFSFVWRRSQNRARYWVARIINLNLNAINLNPPSRWSRPEFATQLVLSECVSNRRRRFRSISASNKRMKRVAVFCSHLPLLSSSAISRLRHFLSVRYSIPYASKQASKQAPTMVTTENSLRDSRESSRYRNEIPGPVRVPEIESCFLSG